MAAVAAVSWLRGALLTRRLAMSMGVVGACPDLTGAATAAWRRKRKCFARLRTRAIRQAAAATQYQRRARTGEVGLGRPLRGAVACRRPRPAQNRGCLRPRLSTYWPPTVLLTPSTSLIRASRHADALPSTFRLMWRSPCCSHMFSSCCSACCFLSVPLDRSVIVVLPQSLVMFDPDACLCLRCAGAYDCDAALCLLCPRCFPLVCVPLVPSFAPSL